MFRTATEVSQEQFEKHFPIPLTHNSCLSSPEGQQLSTRQLKQGACINKNPVALHPHRALADRAAAAGQRS